MRYFVGLQIFFLLVGWVSHFILKGVPFSILCFIAVKNPTPCISRTISATRAVRNLAFHYVVLEKSTGISSFFIGRCWLPYIRLVVYDKVPPPQEISEFQYFQIYSSLRTWAYIKYITSYANLLYIT